MAEKIYPFDLFKGGDSKTVKNSGEEAVARKEGYCEPYKYQEYPKHLYKDGKHEVNHNTGTSSADTRIVKDLDEEKVARADGYRVLGEPEAEEEAKSSSKARKAA